MRSVLSAPEIVHLAVRRADSFGAASLKALAATALDRGLDLSESEAWAGLAADAKAVFLDSDWFWLPARGRNGLVALARRILSVTPPLEVATIRAGVCRTHARRHARLIPPCEVMGALFEAHPGFAVDALGRVGSVGELNYRAELGGRDRVFVEVFRASWTGVLDRAAFRDACVARGMPMRTFDAGVARSVVLDHHAADIWCLRGTRVSPITAAALRHAKALDDS